MYQKPTIFNLTLTDANTEYSQAIPANARKVLVRERTGGADLKLAYISGESGSNFVTIQSGAAKAIDNVYMKDLTLYLQSPTATVVVEIEVWSDL